MIPRKFLPSIGRISVEKAPRGDILSFCRQIPRNGGMALLRTGRVSPGHRYSVLGYLPFLIIRARKNIVEISGREKISLVCDPFKALESVWSFYKGYELPSSLPINPLMIGALSYDLKNTIEDIPESCEDPFDCPDMHFSLFKKILIRDELKQTSRLITLEAESSPTYTAPEASPKRGVIGDLKSDFSEKEYIGAVKSVKKRIVEGDIYQANISQQFSTEFTGDGFGVFEAIDAINPAPMSAYLDCGDFSLISSSPERFLVKKGSRVISSPIKGTRPRGRTPSRDAELKLELLESEKDRAELAMIVDLVRNDLGKTAKPGGVSVSNPRFIEEYSNVFHSIASVSAGIRPGAGPFDVIRSCFPGGSVTGCPKVQAMKVIEETEKHKRSFYCGSIGYVSFNGDFDLNIAIRTFILKSGMLRFNLGGGIVFESDPESEYAETMHKGKSMFESIRRAVTGNKGKT